MGDPKKQKKKYAKPRVGWNTELIEDQKKLMEEFGLRNKKEIYKVEALLTNWRDQAKRFIADDSEQSKKETKQLIDKLSRLNLVKADAKLEDILVLKLEDIMDRRLQSVIFKKGLAKSVKQARQFIVHGHISVNGNKLNVPSYLVPLEEEGGMAFTSISKFSNAEHPEIVKEASKRKKVKKEEEDVEDIFRKEKETPKVVEEKKEEVKVEKVEVEKPKLVKEVPKKEEKKEEKLENAVPVENKDMEDVK